mmetsp:Transcript_42381/g.113373  ORF Transcript_42381/g.113373 Transcript_42381/m.113373 type:complete len:201 (-) Transcript_42381:206-808(-)
MLLALDFAHQWRVQAAAAGGAGRGREEADKRGLTERLGKLAERLRGAVPAAAQAADTQVGELERLLRRRLPTSAADQTNFLEDLKRSEVGKVVAQLRKHWLERVRSKAGAVREAWSGLLPAVHKDAPTPQHAGPNGRTPVTPATRPDPVGEMRGCADASSAPATGEAMQVDAEALRQFADSEDEEPAHETSASDPPPGAG